MGSILNALLNPTAIAVVIIHWIVALFAVLGEEHTYPFHFIYEPLLTQILLIINLPASFLTLLISLPVGHLLGLSGISGDILIYGVYLISVSAQWFIIGTVIGQVWNPSHYSRQISTLELG